MRLARYLRQGRGWIGGREGRRRGGGDEADGIGGGVAGWRGMGWDGVVR